MVRIRNLTKLKEIAEDLKQKTEAYNATMLAIDKDPDSIPYDGLYVTHSAYLKALNLFHYAVYPDVVLSMIEEIEKGRAK